MRSTAAPLTSTSATVSFTVTPVNDTPTIASLSAAPDPVTPPAPVTLTAAGVADADGAGDVKSVSFYRESNGTPALQTGAGGDTHGDTVGGGTDTPRPPTPPTS